MSSALLYIHGFNSSPLSLKARQMLEYCADSHSNIEVIVPQIACYPEQASEQLTEIVEKYQATHKLGLVGSSLGGYLSTWLNDRYGIPAVLINPAVKPYTLLMDYLGEQTNPYTQESYFLTEAHMDALRRLDVEAIKHHDSLWLLQQEGDEVLDYRQAVEKYQGCRQTLEKGGDHSFVGFERYPAEIIQFLGL